MKLVSCYGQLTQFGIKSMNVGEEKSSLLSNTMPKISLNITISKQKDSEP